MARDEIRVLGPLVLTPENVVTFDVLLGDGPATRKITIELMEWAHVGAQCVSLNFLRGPSQSEIALASLSRRFL